MPKSTLTRYKSLANSIMKDIRQLKQREIAYAINVSQQAVSYRINHVYQKELEDIIRICDLAGYEIKKKNDKHMEDIRIIVREELYEILLEQKKHL